MFRHIWLSKTKMSKTQKLPHKTPKNQKKKNQELIEGGIKQKYSENKLQSKLKNIKNDIFKNVKNSKMTPKSPKNPKLKKYFQKAEGGKT